MLCDVRICAYMDFFKYTFQIRFSRSPTRASRSAEKYTIPLHPFTYLPATAGVGQKLHTVHDLLSPFVKWHTLIACAFPVIAGIQGETFKNKRL